MLTVLVLFFGIDLSHADFLSAGVLMLVGSLSIIGIGMMAAALPLLWVERGDQMVFVLNSLLLLVSGVYYSVTILPNWMQAHGGVLAGDLHPRRRSPGADRRRAVHVDAAATCCILAVMAFVFIPLGVFVFGWAERYAKRTGKLKRVG